MSQSHTVLEPVDLNKCGVEVSKESVTLIIPEEGLRPALEVPKEGLRFDPEIVQLSREQVTRVANAAWASLRNLSNISDSDLDVTSIKYFGGDSGSAIQGIVRAAITEAFKTLDSKSELDGAEISVDPRLADRALYTKTVKNIDCFDSFFAANRPGRNLDHPSKLQDGHKENLSVDISIDKSAKVDNGLEVGCSIRLCAGAHRGLPAINRPLVQKALESLINKDDDDSIRYEMTYFKHHGKATPELESLFRETILSAVKEAGMTCSTLRDPRYPAAGSFSVKSKYLSKTPMTQETVTDKARFWLKQNEKKSALTKPYADFATRLADSILQNTHLQQCPAGLTLDQWADTLYNVVSGSVYSPTFAARMNYTKDEEEEILPHLTLASEIGLYRRHEIPKDRGDWGHFDLESENFDEASDIDTATHFRVRCTSQSEAGEPIPLGRQKYIAIRPGEGDKAAHERAQRQVDDGGSACPADLSLADANGSDDSPEIGVARRQRGEESEDPRHGRKKLSTRVSRRLRSALGTASKMFSRESKVSR